VSGRGLIADGFVRCDDQPSLVGAWAFTARLVPAGLAIAGLGLAIAMAAGAIAVPDLAGTFSDATNSLGAWIYPAIAALIFLETSALIGFVIHGELVLLFGGVAAERGDASAAVVIAIAVAAAIAGDVVSLGLGRRLGRPFIETHGARIRFGPERIARIDGFFSRHGGKTIVLGRFTGYLRATLPFVAGSSGMALRRFLPFSAVSAVAWTALYVLIGYAFSESVTSAGDTATRIALVVILAATAGYLIRSRWARRAGR
jgi:membrane protein DedA with SNARE-associated domain